MRLGVGESVEALIRAVALGKKRRYLRYRIYGTYDARGEGARRTGMLEQKTIGASGTISKTLMLTKSSWSYAMMGRSKLKSSIQ